jgi:peptide/nickel transport system permease protein
MLILSRKTNESLVIEMEGMDEPVEIIVTELNANQVRLGIQAPNPEWGAMLAGGRQYIRYAWHITTLPGIALVLTLMSLTLVGDGVRDAMDPRMKR